MKDTSGTGFISRMSEATTTPVFPANFVATCVQLPGADPFFLISFFLMLVLFSILFSTSCPGVHPVPAYLYVFVCVCVCVRTIPIYMTHTHTHTKINHEVSGPDELIFFL
jgi:hypothetical protein